MRIVKRTKLWAGLGLALAAVLAIPASTGRAQDTSPIPPIPPMPCLSVVNAAAPGSPLAVSIERGDSSTVPFNIDFGGTYFEGLGPRRVTISVASPHNGITVQYLGPNPVHRILDGSSNVLVVRLSVDATVVPGTYVCSLTAATADAVGGVDPQCQGTLELRLTVVDPGAPLAPVGPDPEIVQSVDLVIRGRVALGDPVLALKPAAVPVVGEGTAYVGVKNRTPQGGAEITFFVGSTEIGPIGSDEESGAVVSAADLSEFGIIVVMGLGGVGRFRITIKGH